MNLLSEFLCLAVAVYFHRWLRNSPFRYFIPFLAYTLITEILATLVWSQHNGWLYNLYILVQPAFIAAFFSSMLQDRLLRRIILTTLLFYYGFCVYSFINTPFSKFNILVFSLDGLLMTCYSFLFLFFVLKVNDLLLIRKMQPALWITAGILAFFPMTTVLFGVSGIIRFENVTVFGVYLDNFIPQVLSLIMYSCFAYSFYLSKCRQTQ